MDIEKQVQRAASLIARLREVDTDFRVFGADMHRYRIGPPLSEDELQAFEREHKIELPPEYRLYLKTVGNGNGKSPDSLRGGLAAAGAGPDYGIYRIQDSAQGTRTSEAFPFEEEVEIEPDLEELWRVDIPGLLEIGSQGCTGTTHLVVEGAAYGTVWDADHYAHFWATGLSFTQWLCNWAESAISRVLQDRITAQVEEGMALKEVIALCGENGTRPYFLNENLLRFEGLATQFEVDEQDVIIRIIKQSV